MKRLCLYQPLEAACTETFLRAHAEHLPCDVRLVHGVPYPSVAADTGRLQRPGGRLRRVATAVAVAGGWTTRERRAEQAFGRYLRKIRCDAVLAEYGPSGVRIMDTCRKLGLPLAVHFHGADAYQRSWLENEGRRYPELFQQATAIVAVSRDMERQLQSLGAPRHKVHYNPYGVDTGFFTPCTPSQNPPCLLSVGRFVDKKAPQLTIMAFAEARRHVPAARLVMIGDGPLLGPCRALTRGLGLGDAVVFKGAGTPDQVAHAMRGSRAFVQHSIRADDGDCEGTPVAVLEAGACALPVIATAHAGIADVVQHEGTGLLCNECDVNAMGGHMVRLIGDGVLADRLGAAARRRITTEFTLERSIDNLWRILRGAP